jgi:hypothetical protein
MILEINIWFLMFSQMYKKIDLEFFFFIYGL